MKVYKLDEKSLKKKKITTTISGLAFIFISCINAYFVAMGVSETTTGVAMFLIAGVAMFMSLRKIDQFYFELDGSVLTSYLRGRQFCKHDLKQVQVSIRNDIKRPKITILENGKVKAIHNATYIGVESFNEMIEDVNKIIK